MIVNDTPSLFAKQLLLDLRQYLNKDLSDDANFKEKLVAHYFKPQVQKLMEILAPYTRSTFEHSADLVKDVNGLSKELINFLKNIWGDIKGNSLCYTAHPNAPVTQLMCKVASYIAAYALEPEQFSPNYRAQCLEMTLQFLMPGIVFEFTDVAPFEGGNWNDVSILQLLQSHILSSNQRYLIPISCLEKLNQTEAALSKLENIHAILHGDTDHCYLDLNEVNRLKQHSYVTQEIFSAFEAKEALQGQDIYSLYGQINILLRELFINSKHGYGSERKAGATAETALRYFVRFYKQLDADQKSSLPGSIIEQIRYLHLCIADESLGKIKGFNELDTCMASRRLGLKAAIDGHEHLLGQCILPQSNSNQLRENTTERLKHALFSLKQFFTSELQHEVSDSLAIDFLLLDRLGFNIDNLGVQEISEILRSLPSEEISTFISQPAYQSDIISMLTSSINEFAFLAMQLSTEQFRIIYQATLYRFRNSQSLALLCMLDLEKNKIIFDELIKPNLDILIGNKDALFGNGLDKIGIFDKNINGDTIDFFWQALEQSPDIIKQFFNLSFELSEIVCMLNFSKPDRFYWLYAIFEEKIIAHIKTDSVKKIFFECFYLLSVLEIKEKFFSSIEPHFLERLEMSYKSDANLLLRLFFEQSDIKSFENTIIKLLSKKPIVVSDINSFSKYMTSFFIPTEPFLSKFKFLILILKDVDQEKRQIFIKCVGEDIVISICHALLLLDDSSFNSDVLINFIQEACSNNESLNLTLSKIKKNISNLNSFKNIHYLNTCLMDYKKIEDKLFNVLNSKLSNILQCMSFLEFIDFYKALLPERQTWFFESYQDGLLAFINDGFKLQDMIFELGHEKTQAFIQLLESRIINEKLPENIHFEFSSLLKQGSEYFSMDWLFYLKILKIEPCAYQQIPDEIKDNKTFIFSAYIIKPDVIAYLPDQYKIDGLLQAELLITEQIAFVECLDNCTSIESIEKFFILLTPYLDNIFDTPKEINLLAQHANFYNFLDLALNTGLVEKLLAKLALCDINFICSDLDEMFFGLFSKYPIIFESVIYSKIVRHQQAGIILNKILFGSCRHFHVTDKEKVTKALDLFFEKLQSKEHLQFTTGNTIKIIADELENEVYRSLFFENILSHHQRLLEMGCNLYSIFILLENRYRVDEPFCLSAITQHADVFDILPENFRADMDFIQQAIERNPRVADFVSDDIRKKLAIKTKIHIWQSTVVNSISFLFAAPKDRSNNTCFEANENQPQPRR